MTKQMTRPAHKGRSSKAPETKAPETKATGNEVATAFEEFMQAFVCYKETNDERLSQMEQRVGTDVVTTEKMDRISRSMDEQKRKLDQMIIKGSRPVLGSRSNPLHDDEHKNAFNAYIRRGDENSFAKSKQKPCRHQAIQMAVTWCQMSLIKRSVVDYQHSRQFVQFRLSDRSQALCSKTVCAKWHGHRLGW